jgi:hypothetical protein
MEAPVLASTFYSCDGKRVIDGTSRCSGGRSSYGSTDFVML